MMKLRYLGAALIWAATGCALGIEDATAEQDLELGTVSSAVHTDTRQTQHFRVAIEQADDLPVTGAIRVPARNAAGGPRLNAAGQPVVASCGLTFISPHYAITAAHCVESHSVPNPATDLLTVEQYDLTNVNRTKLASSYVVSGNFPNYTRPTLTEADGYKVTRYTQCKVVRRCSAVYGPTIGCDTPSDVALIHCADRPRTAPWIPVAHSEIAGAPVEMVWFHELLDMPLDPPGPGPIFTGNDPNYVQRVGAWLRYKDRFDHYTVYHGFGMADENYHYTYQQLLPLRSLSWWVGDLQYPRRRTGDDTPNMIGDGNFETQTSATLTNWGLEGVGHGVDIDRGTEMQGRKNAFIRTQTGWNAITRDVTIERGHTFAVSAWLRNSRNFQGGYMGVRDAASNRVLFEVNFGPLADYTYQHRSFLIHGPTKEDPATTQKLRVFVGYWAPGQDSWLQIDDVRLHMISENEEKTNNTWTDLFGCHGTSGSGILQRNAGKLELLGPVSRGDMEDGFLCHHGPAVVRRGRHLSYPHPEFSQELERAVLSDRKVLTIFRPRDVFSVTPAF